jgi:dTDP-4-dehydrorhamnose 3,5-epimerase-like enzyme
MIIDQLTSLAQQLRGQVPDRIVDLYEGDVNAGELQLAIEELFDALMEDDIRIPSDLAHEIQALADELHVTRFSPEELAALVRD